MAIHYLQDQSWLDLLLLTLPVFVPLFISLYFLMTEQPRPGRHADLLPFNNNSGNSHQRNHHVSGQDRHVNDDVHQGLRHTPTLPSITLTRSEIANPSVRRRQIARPTSPPPFEHGVYTPEPRRSPKAERRRVNEDDLIHREYLRQLLTQRSQYQDSQLSNIVPMQEPAIPENAPSHQDPWIPDDFRLPQAADEQGTPPEEHTFVLVDRSRDSSWEVVSDAEEREWQHVKVNLRGGGGDELVALRPVRARMTEAELREHIRRNRAETLAMLEYYGKAAVRARERDDRDRR